MQSKITFLILALIVFFNSFSQQQLDYGEHFFVEYQSIKLQNNIVGDLGIMTSGEGYDLDLKRQKEAVGIFNEVLLQQQDQKQKWYATDTGASLIASGALIGLGLFTYKDTGFLNRIDNYEFIQRYFPNFENHLDDYTQFIPYIGVYAFDAFGVNSKHKTWRKTTTMATSLALNLIVIQTLKYTIAEPRPDGSANNSFPSGHTATAFMGAHIFHKEYGERSPYYSIGAYILAAITGVFRQLNNRHWSSDVLVGAGLGISLTELAYFLNDNWWKEDGKNEINYAQKKDANYNKPAFLGVKASFAQLLDGNEDFGLIAKTGFAMDLEGAYFFNKYIGIGGSVGIQSFPLQVDPSITNQFQNEGYDILAQAVGSSKYSVGPYFQLPFNQGKTSVGVNFQFGYSSIADTKVQLIPIGEDVTDEDVIDYAIFIPKGGNVTTSEFYFRHMLSKQLYIGLYANYNHINTDLQVRVIDDINASEPTYTTENFKDTFHSYNVGGRLGVMIW
ncbi:phosphatase PAP2 family protein [Winogradskyella aurantiaca]|uniref:phosphatase PAP2 family protein n=1 Tax=Winogradskyella aurantiaca TaxID=2219558 RepID=UPI000E1CBFC9|nr:phosphatase PAP2 family protein [Winogradskyella aurantiaca]